MSKKQNLYLGKAGQFFVMSELLFRGWNVATPEVDVGDDIFVVKDADGQLIRVQVKTATAAMLKKGGLRAQFSLNLAQLQSNITPMLVYALVFRLGNKWEGVVLIKRDILLEEHQNFQLGNISNGLLNIYFSFKNSKLTCSKRDLTQYLNNFADFDVIQH
ncbi:MAG: hypothetical protein SFV22_12000 [Saprospiraceae bacterium]|nr:hypothetical protein [Saprospiraceae bacterium]